MREWRNYLVITNDGCEHRVFAASRWHAARIVEERNYCRVTATIVEEA